MIRLSSCGAQSIRTAIREHPQLWGFLATPRLSGRWRRKVEAWWTVTLAQAHAPKSRMRVRWGYRFAIGARKDVKHDERRRIGAALRLWENRAGGAQQ
jgi:hypothetical protein